MIPDMIHTPYIAPRISVMQVKITDSNQVTDQTVLM